MTLRAPMMEDRFLALRKERTGDVFLCLERSILEQPGNEENFRFISGS